MSHEKGSVGARVCMSLCARGTRKDGGREGGGRGRTGLNEEAETLLP